MNEIRLMIVIALLAGCTTTLTHPTKGPAEFDQDLLDCETRAAPIHPPLRASEFVGRCLAAKGWRPQ